MFDQAGGASTSRSSKIFIRFLIEFSAELTLGLAMVDSGWKRPLDFQGKTEKARRRRG